MQVILDSKLLSRVYDVVIVLKFTDRKIVFVRLYCDSAAKVQRATEAYISEFNIKVMSEWMDRKPIVITRTNVVVVGCGGGGGVVVVVVVVVFLEG